MRGAMNPGDNKEFIRKIRLALGYRSQGGRTFSGVFPDGRAEESVELIRRIKNRGPDERQWLLARLIEEAKALNMMVVPVKDAQSAAKQIAKVAQEKETEWGGPKRVIAWEHPLIERMKLNRELQKKGIPLDFTIPGPAGMGTDMVRERVIASYIGVTSAEFCVASSATLVMKTRPGQPRSVSLVPTIHMAVIEQDQIIADLRELYALLKWDPYHKEEGLTNCMTFITGPSKTGDIELILIHGAHGPKELYLYVITG